MCSKELFRERKSGVCMFYLAICQVLINFLSCACASEREIHWKDFNGMYSKEHFRKLCLYVFCLAICQVLISQQESFESCVLLSEVHL